MAVSFLFDGGEVKECTGNEQGKDGEDGEDYQ